MPKTVVSQHALALWGGITKPGASASQRLGRRYMAILAKMEANEMVGVKTIAEDDNLTPEEVMQQYDSVIKMYAGYRDELRDAIRSQDLPTLRRWIHQYMSIIGPFKGMREPSGDLS